uniref:Uncharacterized protein n=1 Tax=Anguilla anguilla TaxID=7936 RepID=A0A0E9Q043_ANGAN
MRITLCQLTSILLNFSLDQWDPMGRFDVGKYLRLACSQKQLFRC